MAAWRTEPCPLCGTALPVGWEGARPVGVGPAAVSDAAADAIRAQHATGRGLQQCRSRAEQRACRAEGLEFVGTLAPSLARAGVPIEKRLTQATARTRVRRPWAPRWAVLAGRYAQRHKRPPFEVIQAVQSMPEVRDALQRVSAEDVPEATLDDLIEQAL